MNTAGMIRMKTGSLIKTGIILTFFSSLSIGQPRIITLLPDSITATSALLHARCYTQGKKTEISFFITNKGTSLCGYNVPAQYIDTDADPSDVSILVTGLMQSADYRCNAVARFESQEYVYGGEISFTTSVDTNAKGFTIPLHFQDTAGLNTASLMFGIHTCATYCTDWQLGECELPPIPPPGVQDYRFVDPHSAATSCLGNGLNQDLRQYRDSTQVDTFELRLQPANGSFPVIISWPELENYYQGPVRLLDQFGGVVVDIDMKAQHSVTASFNELLIIAERPANLISASYDYLSFHSVIVNGSFNPHGLPTNVWFEWGETSRYGNSTQTKYIGDGTDPVKFLDSITNLQKDFVYHFRAAIQNVRGIVYGIDQTFIPSNIAKNVLPPKPTPVNYRLYQNYPNPFNPGTIIQYDLPASSHVTLQIYNILGQKIETLVDETQPSGIKSITFDGNNLSGGIYIYKLTAGSFSAIRKMLFIK